MPSRQDTCTVDVHKPGQYMGRGKRNHDRENGMDGRVIGRKLAIVPLVHTCAHSRPNGMITVPVPGIPLCYPLLVSSPG